MRGIQAVVIGIAFVALGLLYYHAANQHMELLNPAKGQDQGAYAGIVVKMYQSRYSYDGDRNRMPLYPFVQSLFYDPAMTEQELLTQGKRVNIILSLVILFFLFLIFRRHFPLHHSLNLLLLTAFSVYIFKAAYFQPELLFYALFFCSFLLLWRMLTDPTWQSGIAAGVMLGLAHLTKASVLPALGLFLLFFALKEVSRLYAGWKHRPAEPFQKRLAVARWGSLLLLLVVFTGIIYPYISKSKRVYGHYFYNVNSTFYMWYDSWEEAQQGTHAHGDRHGWPDMPPELIPSPAKYLREHTTAQILGRISDGARVVIERCMNSYGFFNYVLIYAGFALLLVALNLRRSIELVRKHLFLTLFLLSFFVVYFLLYAWYVPIDAGERFILSLFLPFMFTASTIIVQLSKGSSVKFRATRVPLLSLFNTIVLFVISVDIYFVLTHKILTMNGGS